MQEKALRQLQWLNSKDGGGMRQRELADLLGTTQAGVSLYLSRGVRSQQAALLIGRVFADRCAALGLDAAAVDAALEADDSHAFAA